MAAADAQASGWPAVVPLKGFLGTYWSDASPSILPATFLCGLLCCLCGYFAFLYIQALEQSKQSFEPFRDVDGHKASRSSRRAEGVPGASYGLQDRGAKELPAAPEPPDTPSTLSQAPLRLEKDSGDSSRLTHRVLSGHLPEGVPVDPSLLQTSTSTRALGVSPSARGPLTADVPDGEQNYVWDDGTEYFGEWRGGCAQGRGVFSWPSGDRYEGEWEHGQENGVGTYIYIDGSTYYGFWSDGKRHGEGVYKPGAADNQRAEVMFMREYDQGRLLKETVLRVKDYDLHRKELKRDHRARRVERKQAAKELALTRPGETIYKGHRSYDLMRNLQMGILFSIAKTNQEFSKRDSGTWAADYKSEVTQQFPRSGQSTSFKWKDYCPLIFHRLRQAFGIDNRDYLLSLTGDKALRELPSPGKSGSVFFISDDDRFMIKTVRKEEMRLLLELVPKYHKHCTENPNTLLTRFYGVHRVKPINGHHVRFLVMGNVFPTEARLHRKFDLKGSTYGRSAGAKRADSNATLKDLDVDFRLQLKDTYHHQLMQQIEADAGLLERMHVMDYSLLLGIHYVDWEDNWYPPSAEAAKKDGDLNGFSKDKINEQKVGWEDEYAAAERGSLNFSPEKTVFNRWHSQKQMMVDEPSQPIVTSERTSRDEEDSHRLCTPPTTSEIELPSPASSMTSMSMASTSGASSAYRKMGAGQGMQKAGSVEDFRAGLRSCVGITMPSGSWPSTNPLRPTRFALESRSEVGDPAGMPGLRSAFASPSRFAPALLEEPQLVPPETPKDYAEAQEPSGPDRRLFDAESVAREHEGVFRGPGEDLEASEQPSPSFLRLLNRVQLREDRHSLGENNLGRTRSGWLREGDKGTNLPSLHSEARRHMGVSIPALAFPLTPDGIVDTEAKPQPVTLFFGIIDFLQDYNLRKRTEHMLKSIVQDGKAISVTSPHTYSRRFIRFMRNLFLAVP